MLYELDILPVKLQVIYKRMMVYHEIINSDKERVARKILLEQEKYGHKESFVGNMKDEGEEIGLNVRKEEVLNKAKSVWKGEVKVKIKEAFCVQAEEEKQKKKMRFLKCQGIRTYLNHVYNSQASMAIKIRLNMVQWIGNNGGVKEKCPLCDAEDTTEHVFNCEAVENRQNVNVRDLERGEKMKEIRNCRII